MSVTLRPRQFPLTSVTEKKNAESQRLVMLTQFFLPCPSLRSPPAPPLSPHQQISPPVSCGEGNSKGFSEMGLVVEGSQPGRKDLLEIVPWKINTLTSDI